MNGVYPRACGGTCMEHVKVAHVRGLSPRLRGNLDHALGLTPYQRSIPAPAGEPSQSGLWVESVGVYPRACGGTSCSSIARTSCIGLSPRLRGNLDHHTLVSAVGRSIPAPAGGTIVSARPVSHSRKEATGGLSPRLRGNLTHDGQGYPHQRSIPRLRGNQLLRRRADGRGRSIPAPAGEPPSLLSPIKCRTVYPRACGGTTDSARSASYRIGLSPRLRGNLRVHGQTNARSGSIPAPAGEPSCGMKVT